MTGARQPAHGLGDMEHGGGQVGLVRDIRAYQCPQRPDKALRVPPAACPGPAAPSPPALHRGAGALGCPHQQMGAPGLPLAGALFKELLRLEGESTVLQN